jgi:UDP-N-acetylmuramoyl-tripeptide--D-alanyl-D-alanine ligase
MPAKKTVKPAAKKISEQVSRQPKVVKPAITTKTVSQEKVAKPAEIPAFDVDALLAVLRPVIREVTPVKPVNVPLKAIRVDSRRCRKGDVFVGLKGENTHGADFMAAAVKTGVSLVVSDRPRPADLPDGVTHVEVEDGLLAFRKMASAWRMRHQIPVIGVAGSVGKTTTKDLLAAILSGKFNSVLKTEGSQNGFTGIPVTLAAMTKDHKAAVIEIGIDDVGAMAQHLDVVRPDITIVTAVAPEHLEKLKDIETVAAEETLALKRTASAGGIAVINLDDEHCRTMGNTIKAEHRVGFSLYPKLKPRPDLLVGRLSLDGLTLEVSGDIRGLRFVREQFKLPLLGKHNASNLLGAICVAGVTGATPEQMRRGLESFEPGFGRSRIEQLSSGVLVICDYYNANPASVSAALDLLRERSTVKGRRGKKYACLGDMLELGRDEELLHRRLADKLAATGVDKVLLFGERMKWLADELKRRKFESDVEHFESHLTLSDHLKENLRPDDYVLIKGSRGMAMERVWENLQNPKTLV